MIVSRSRRFSKWNSNQNFLDNLDGFEPDLQPFYNGEHDEQTDGLSRARVTCQMSPPRSNWLAIESHQRRFVHVCVCVCVCVCCEMSSGEMMPDDDDDDFKDKNKFESVPYQGDWLIIKSWFMIYVRDFCLVSCCQSFSTSQLKRPGQTLEQQRRQIWLC